MRILWFWISLAAACVGGYFAYDTLPELISWLTGSDLSQSYVSVLTSSLTVSLAGRIALAVIVFTLLGLVIPAIIDTLALGGARAKVKSFPPETSSKSTMPTLEFQAELSDIPLLEEAIPAYARFLIECEDTTSDNQGNRKRQPKILPKLKALVPAGTFFGPTILVEENLFGWIFKPLPSLLLAAGLIIFVGTCLTGFHDYRQTLPLDPVAGAGILWSWVEKGLLALSLTATGALITLIISRATYGLHSLRVRSFCRFMDIKFAYSPPSAALGEVAANAERENRKAEERLQRLGQDITKSFEASQQQTTEKLTQAVQTLELKLSRSIETSLRAPLESLTAASSQVTGKQSEIAASVVKSTLEAFIKNLEKELGGQLQKSNALLKSATLLSTKLEKGYLGSFKDLAKQGEAQGNAVSTVSREINETLKELKGFEKTLEQAVLAIQPTLDRVLENQASLLNALQDEKGAGKTIKDAAAEMGKAAKASKDTMEGFITLAEKLTEASRSLSGTPGAARPDGAGTGKTLGKALRGLRDKAESTGKLPKL